MLALAAIVWVAVVLSLVYGLCKAAGRPRPTPPPLHDDTTGRQARRTTNDTTTRGGEDR